MASDNHVESFKLLNATDSNSESDEILNAPAPRRKIKIRRKLRPSSSAKKGDGRLCSLAFLLKALGILSLLLLAGAMGWFGYNLYHQIGLLARQLQDLEVGTRKTPEELHYVHAQMKTLEDVTAAMKENVTRLTVELGAMSAQVQELAATASRLESSIASAPAIHALPKQVTSLQESVATMGSKITNLETTVKGLKEHETSAGQQLQTQADLVQKLYAFYNRSSSVLQSAEAATTAPPPPAWEAEGSPFVRELRQLEASFDELNQTLGARVHQAVSAAGAEQRGLVDALLRNASAIAGRRLAALEDRMANDTCIVPRRALEQQQQRQVADGAEPQEGGGGGGGVSCSIIVADRSTLRNVSRRVDDLTHLTHALSLNFTEFRRSSEAELEDNLLNATVVRALKTLVDGALQRLGPAQQQSKQQNHSEALLDPWSEQLPAQRTSPSKAPISSSSSSSSSTAPATDAPRTAAAADSTQAPPSAPTSERPRDTARPSQG